MLCSFFLRSYFRLLVSIDRSIIHNPMFFTYSSSIFAPPSTFSHASFVILLFRLSSSVSLHCHRSEYSCEFCAAKRAVWVRGSFNFVTVCGPTVTTSQSTYRHLIAPFQLLSVILSTHVLLSLFHYIFPLFPPSLSAARHFRLIPSA
jgi:hypothetical protein